MTGSEVPSVSGRGALPACHPPEEEVAGRGQRAAGCGPGTSNSVWVLSPGDGGHLWLQGPGWLRPGASLLGGEGLGGEMGGLLGGAGLRIADLGIFSLSELRVLGHLAEYFRHVMS